MASRTAEGSGGLQIAVLGPVEACVDGRPVARADDLRSVDVGWTVRTGRFGGVLLKLHPRHGFSHVVVEGV